jgi:hypothetical protein
MLIKIQASLDVMPCQQMSKRRFEGSYCLHHLGLLDLKTKAVFTSRHGIPPLKT